MFSSIRLFALLKVNKSEIFLLFFIFNDVIFCLKISFIFSFVIFISYVRIFLFSFLPLLHFLFSQFLFL